MQRERAVEIAQKWAKNRPDRFVQATTRYDGEWCVRVELISGMELWADTEIAARDAYKRLPAFKAVLRASDPQLREIEDQQRLPLAPTT